MALMPQGAVLLGIGGPGRASGTSRNGYNGGGGYGGSGSKGSYGVGGVTYGNPYAPLLPGSGGSGGVDFAPFSEVSGYGGGLIRVDAQRNIQLDGQIVADGCAGIGAYRYTGGGSGGGILISCNRFLGSETALLSARGGNGGASGGGGGGRIAVWHKRMPTHLQAKLLTGITGTAITSMTNPADYLGQVNVGGGTGSTPVAQPGSIWFIMPPPPGAMVLVR